ncbi:MAG: hypothetical protein RBR59_01355 [Sulfurimonadaceae bacterium]|jgi:hypothetical protein|nr:hypothetical protein [Sulfurimonadaceae bacterium]
MKNASQIITSLQNKPQFSKLSRYKCIQKIESAFTPALRKMIKFGYIKNNILFFVLSHPAGKQEFDNSIQNIKSALKFYMPKECETTPFDDIKAFVTHTPPKVPPKENTSAQMYKERANGDFLISVNDAKLITLLEDIKKSIKENQ